MSQWLCNTVKTRGNVTKDRRKSVFCDVATCSWRKWHQLALTSQLPLLNPECLKLSFYSSSSINSIPCSWSRKCVHCLPKQLTPAGQRAAKKMNKTRLRRTSQEKWDPMCLWNEFESIFNIYVYIYINMAFLLVPVIALQYKLYKVVVSAAHSPSLQPSQHGLSV